MKMQLQKKICAFLATVMFSFYAINTQSQTETTIDSLILKSITTRHIPGLAAVVIKNGKVAWTKGYGFANLEKNIPFTPNTIHAEIGSISKTVTATALMQLFEKGFFKLDDPINRYLPFTVKNPYYPTIPITFRMLFNHTSSISESGDAFIFNFDFNNTPNQPLGSYLYDVLNPGGALYADSVYSKNYPPGTHWRYSNFAYALMGFLVEHLSHIPFDKYCNIHIFQPLCMEHTGWHFSDIDTNITSRPYYYDDGINKNIDYGFYEYPDYPDGEVKTTVTDLAKYMLMHMNYGIVDGVRILDSSTVAIMRENPVLVDTLSGGSDGLGFFFNPDYCGAKYWFHHGADPGILGSLFFNPVNSTGVIIFENGEEGSSDATCDNGDLLHLLASFAATINTEAKPDLNCSYVSTPCEHGTIFWKNNADKWALSASSMKLGTQHFYNKPELLALLDKPVNGNALLVLAKQLIAAKLNAAQGSELSSIILTINAANNLIGNRLLPKSKVSFYSSEGIKMLAMALQLNLYNYRYLNTGNCSGNGYGEAAEVNDMEMDMHAGQEPVIFPNPLSNSTTISFVLAQSQTVSLKIFDVNGRLIETLSDAIFAEGENSIEWNSENVDAGVYFLQIQSEEFSKMEKLIVTK